MRFIGWVEAKKPNKSTLKIIYILAGMNDGLEIVINQNGNCDFEI